LVLWVLLEWFFFWSLWLGANGDFRGASNRMILGASAAGRLLEDLWGRGTLEAGEGTGRGSGVYADQIRGVDSR
jgi:hypothetical protein